jgi:DNA helicase-4
MSRTWGSTPLGELFTDRKPWSLSIDGDRFQLSLANKRVDGSVVHLANIEVKTGFFWASIRITCPNGEVIDLDGIENDEALEIRTAWVFASISLKRREEEEARREEEEAQRKNLEAMLKQEAAECLRQLGPKLEEVKIWVSNVKTACKKQLGRRGWLSNEFTADLAASKPKGLAKLLAFEEVKQQFDLQDEATKEAVAMWRRSVTRVVDGINKRHLAKELHESRQFFDSVEKSPLTKEQAEAVICFDNRVLLVASAGSGKTSTMVAKAGYALQRGYFEADRILLLAFNSDAAAELRDRINARLNPINLPADKIVAKTFHAFGLDVIGAATGKKPSLAPWVETGRDHQAIQQFVAELNEEDPQFRKSWDILRLVFGQDLPKFGKEAENPEAWDRASGRRGFETLNGDVVKSRGEVVIANWLFYNGVKYVYEAPYKVDTASAQHRQYRPDFYLPGPDVYLEHWAIDSSGEPPSEFIGYKESMAWKKGVHAENRTRLLETTMADIWSGKAFTYLERELSKLGVMLNPNPDREVPGREPIDSLRLVKTIRSFITHAKSNRLAVTELRQRMDDGVAGQFLFRHKMFLAIFEKIWERWERRLSSERCIDFEDMLNLAADCIEQGRWESPYELVMVDEFQDASQARARLIAGLVNKPDRFLFAVGDDWQSINRFAGADLGVMTDFESKFGKAVTLKLETTFRCSQALCDISSQFVQKNPKQLKKHVRSPRNNVDQPVRIVSVQDETQIRSAVKARIAELAKAHSGSGQPTTVYVLGRYRRDKAYIPRAIESANVKVEFITVHSSKGLEADHVILPRITSETQGFPSRVIDDPVLQLAMPGGDGFEFSEERRLFYVALTRARQTVTLVTLSQKESSFVTELVRDCKLSVLNADGTKNANEVCPKCGSGFFVPRNGRYGPFFGCTNFPRCGHTRNAAADSRVLAGVLHE